MQTVDRVIHNGMAYFHSTHIIIQCNPALYYLYIPETLKTIFITY